jgi:hypothetical protein
MTGHAPHAGCFMTFAQATAARGDGTSIDGAVTGIMAGSLILTAEGAVPVELLGPGDRIISRRSGMVRLRAVRLLPYAGDVVHLGAGALGAQRPASDTLLAAGQSLLWRKGGPSDGAGGRTEARSIAARDLVAEGQAVMRRGDGLHLAQLEFDHEEVVYADGLELICAPTQGLRLVA